MTGKVEHLTSFSFQPEKSLLVDACKMVSAIKNFSELLGEDRHEDELSDGDSDIDEPIHY